MSNLITKLEGLIEYTILWDEHIKKELVWLYFLNIHT